MNKKELKSILLKQLAVLLSEHGFVKRVYGQSIKKPIEKGTAKIHLSFIDYKNDFDVTVDAGIRFDDLEDLKNANNIQLTAKEKLNTSTIGTELGNISISQPRRWTIKNEGEIEVIIQNMFEEIIAILFPFIEKYSVRENVYNLCIKDDSEANLICPLDFKRAINAVGLAILLKKDDKFIELVITKMKYLEDKSDMGLSIYLNFIEKHI